MDKKPLIPIIAIVFTNFMGATMVVPTLPIYALDQFHSTILQATLLATAYFAAQFLAGPVLGRLSDQYGRRPLLIISQAGTAFSFALFVFALPLGQIIDSWGLSLGINGGLLMMYLARILDGITGGNISIAQAYVADISTSENRTQLLGLLSASVSVGFIFGPGVGGLLANQFGLVAPFVAGTIIATLTLILTTIMLTESLPPKKRATPDQHQDKRIAARQVFRNPAFITVLSIGFLATLCFSAIPPTFVLYADVVLFPDEADPTRVVRNVGLIFMMIGMTSVFTQAVLLKPLADYFGERKLVAIGQSLTMLVYIFVPMFTNPLLIILILIPFAFSRSITNPTLQSLVTRFGNEQTQGQLLGTYQSSLSLAFIFGPIWAGYVFENISPQALWWVGSVILIPAVLLAYTLTRRPLPILTPEA